MAGPKLVVSIVGDATSLERSFARANRSAHGFGAAVGGLSVGFGQLVKGVVIVDAVQKAMQGLRATVGAGISEFRENAAIQAQTAAALKSTGNIAGVTSDQIRALSLSLSNLSGISDESIRAAENVELSFTNIRNSAGKGNDIFTQATKTIVDFAARTGRDAPAAAILFGKALEDPAKRVGILARAGVVLSTSQIKVLKSTEATKGILAAQKILLQELTIRFGGAAAAAGQTLPGALNILKERFRDLAGQGVGLVSESLRKAAVALSGFVVKITDAKGFRAKLNIVWTGIKDAAVGAQRAIGDAIAAVDWNKVWSQAKGIGAGLQARLQQIDWRAVGKSIGDGIAAAIKVAVPAAGALADKVSQVIAKINWDLVGRAIGPGLATAVVVAFSTLTDPTFWVKHWDLALAVATVGFGGAIGRVAGKLGRLLLKPFADIGIRAGNELALSIAVPLVRVSARLADIVLRGLEKIPNLVARLAVRMFAPIDSAFESLARRLGRPLLFVLKVIGVKAVIDAVANLVTNVAQLVAKPFKIAFEISGLDAAISTIRGAFAVLTAAVTGNFEKVWEKLKEGAIRAALSIIEPFTHLPGFLGGGPFREIKDSLQQTLTDMQTTGAVGGAAVTTSIFAGMTGSIKTSVPGFAAALQDAVSSATAGIAATAAKAVGAATKGPQGLRGPAVVPPTPPAGLAGLAPAVLPAVADDLLGHPAKRKGITASQRNTFFDNNITRLLDRVQDLPIKAQIAKLKAIAGLITERLAATKDVTRRLTLEDQLASIARTIKATGATITGQAQTLFDSTISSALNRVSDLPLKQQVARLAAIGALITARIAATKDVVRKKALEDTLLSSVTRPLAAARAQLAQNFLDSLQFGVTKAEATAGLADDLAANAALQAGLKKQIASAKDATDLQRQLFDAQQHGRDLEQQQRQKARQHTADRLQLASDRAAATPGLRDDLAAALAQVANDKALIKRLGSTTALQTTLLTDLGTVKGIRQQTNQTFLDALSFKFDKAAVTKSQQDDLAALDAWEKGVRALIKKEGDSLAFEHDLFDIGQKRLAVNQQIAANRTAARNATQFKALGLTATGDTKIPGVTALKTQLGTIGQALSGTFLDTSKTRSLLSHIREVLSGGLGAVGRDVRDKIKTILDDITNQLKNHAGDQTKFRHISAKNLLAGFGLTPEQLRQIAPVIAQIGPGGTIPQRSTQFALAGGGGWTVNGGLHLHGIQDLRTLETDLERRKRSRPQTRRGAG